MWNRKRYCGLSVKWSGMKELPTVIEPKNFDSLNVVWGLTKLNKVKKIMGWLKNKRDHLTYDDWFKQR